MISRAPRKSGEPLCTFLVGAVYSLKLLLPGFRYQRISPWAKAFGLRGTCSLEEELQTDSDTRPGRAATDPSYLS